MTSSTLGSGKVTKAKNQGAHFLPRLSLVLAYFLISLSLRLSPPLLKKCLFPESCNSGHFEKVGVGGRGAGLAPQPSLARASLDPHGRLGSMSLVWKRLGGMMSQLDSPGAI